MELLQMLMEESHQQEIVYGMKQLLLAEINNVKTWHIQLNMNVQLD
jgi:hypothetical protein